MQNESVLKYRDIRVHKVNFDRHTHITGPYFYQTNQHNMQDNSDVRQNLIKISTEVGEDIRRFEKTYIIAKGNISSQLHQLLQLQLWCCTH